MVLDKNGNEKCLHTKHQEVEIAIANVEIIFDNCANERTERKLKGQRLSELMEE